MTLLCGGYQGAKSCRGVAQPGNKALMSWFLGAYGPLGGVNSGIVNCRDIAGSGTLSLHAEGRACDLGIRPYSADYGTVLARALVEHSKELGIQLVIWNRQIWSSSYCDKGWRDYGGTNPHVDHLHVELSWWGAEHLTVELIQSTIGGSGSMLPIRKGTKSGDVELVQRMLVALGYETAVIDKKTKKPIESTRYDGDYGDALEAAVNRYRADRNLGSVDRVTPWMFYSLIRAVGDLDDNEGLSEAHVDRIVKEKVDAAIAELPPIPPHSHTGEVTVS